LFFKFFFYRTLVKIYFQIFRFKKNNLKETTSSQLIRNNLVFIIITIIAIILIVSNVKNKNSINPPESTVSKTVMANLVKNEFSSLGNEELVEESYTPDSLRAAGKEKYLDSFSTIEKQTGLSNATGDEEYNPSVIVNEDGLAIKPRLIGSNLNNNNDVTTQRNEIIYYTVQKGDVVSNIARKFDITVNTILWSNNLTAFSLIRPGDSLMILPYSGIIHTVKSGDTISRLAKLYGVEEEKIFGSNKLGNSLKIGDKIIIPGGRKIITNTIASRVSNNGNTGLSIIRDLVKSQPASSGGAKMAWPTQGHRITQYFSWRHNGLDIGNKVGTPIYAADDGIVEISQGGYNGGYGNTIVINHGGGIKTRYGHASKLFVKAGDRVEKGENIAAMGSTGRSTGSHLHFEVLINKSRYNPLNYIK